MADGFSRRYGASPAHFALIVVNLVVAAYVVTRVVQVPHAGQIALWFVGGIVLVALVLIPMVLLVDAGISQAARRWPGGPVAWRNHLPAPLLVGGLLFLVFWPLVLAHAPERYRNATGLDPGPYAGRWLGVVVVSASVSALVYAVRALAAARSVSATRTDGRDTATDR